ncbi:MAG: hypothetical protein O2971_04240 [Proteobacteria bacterium]|nr:hypothetical protein [Pseudomonadota bacterium]
MPHQIIEVSPNLPEVLDLKSLVQALHECAAEQEALPLGGLRTRVHIAAEHLIADQSPAFGFIAVYLRIAEGRTDAIKKQIGAALFQCLCHFVDSALGEAPVALSYEIQEINPNFRWNRNKIADFMVGQQESS